MAKQQPRESVLHDWVCDLPFTQQAVLLLALRGPDGLPKNTFAKQILHFLRGAVVKPAYPEFDGTCDGFMRTDYGDKVSDHAMGIYREVGWQFESLLQMFFSDVDQLPHHFYMHLVHAAEIIGYNYPDEQIAGWWIGFYRWACDTWHLHPETKEELDHRLMH